jgi:ABC-type phosphate/phosphonate transport system substrate-binding protein
MASTAERRHGLRYALIPMCLVLTMCSLRNGAARAEGGQTQLKIGFSSRAFVNAPREDIGVAANILVQKVARRTVSQAESHVYETPAEMARDINAKKLDVIALTPEDFLDLSGRALIDPVMLTAGERGHEVEFLLLVRKDSRIRNIRELRNRSIAMPAKVVQYGNMYFTWVDNLVNREGFHDMGKFFSCVREARNPSQALMQVFFRQADACAVSRQVFDLTNELNPQIGRDIMALARIDRLAGGIIAVRRDLPEDLRQKITQAMLTLHEDPEGRQLFVMFQMSRLVPFRPEYLNATKAFFSEHRNRRLRVGGRP